MTEEELRQLGWEVVEDPTHDRYTRQGRPITNIEMMAVRHYLLSQKEQAHRHQQLLPRIVPEGQRPAGSDG